MTAFLTTPGLTEYAAALELMQQRQTAVANGEADELVWFLQHPPLYTAGTSAKPQDLLTPQRFPVFETGRGGEYTYHGPGQRVVYLMLDLNQRGRDVRAYVRNLERWLILALSQLGVKAETRDGRVGLWVSSDQGREDKIAAIGVRIRAWVTSHGVALNVDPDLEHFSGIVPCGIQEHGVTSLARLAVQDPTVVADMARVDIALRGAFEQVFGLL